MTVDELLAEAAKRGLQLAGLRQYAYALGGKSRTDHWEAHFHDARGNGVSGSGRSALLALQSALFPASVKAEPAQRDLSYLD